MGNDFLQNLNKTVLNEEWMKNIYAQQRADQQSALKKVFTVVCDNDVTDSQRKALEAKQVTLQDRVEKLEAKMAVLEEELAKNQEEIKKQSDAITGLVSSVQGKSNTLEQRQALIVKSAVNDTFAMYEKGTIGKDAITGEIKRRIQNNSYISSSSKEIEKLLSNLENKQSEVQDLVDTAAKWIDQKNLLESQYGPTKSAYEMIVSSISKMGTTSTSFTNTDATVDVPIYSLEKTEIVGELFDSKMNVEPGNNTSYTGEETANPDATVNAGENNSSSVSANSIQAINEKYAQYLKPELTTGVDPNTTNNNAVVQLGNAINAGLLDDIKASNMSQAQAAQFLSENFGNAQINYSNGKLSVPNGMNAGARPIYASIVDFINNYQGTGKSQFEGTLNTWDSEQGNTISSNKQLASLAENYEQILNKLGNSEPKFTFKEAMYALFDKDKGLFKNTGVIYDLDNQDQGANYAIELAGDSETAQMFEGLSQKIYDIWGVKPGVTASYDGEYIDPDTTPGGSVGNDSDDSGKIDSIQRTDPLSFKTSEDKEFLFVIDRDNDGAFSGASDFVGGSTSSTWLDDLKSLDADNNGVLEGDELANLKLISTEYTDNAQTQQRAGGFLSGETTNVAYGLTSAKGFGIDKIDLNGLEDNVNNSTGKTDINNSEIFNDGFTFTANGVEYDVSRKDDTNEFMEAIYSDAYGKNFEINISEDEVEETINKNYAEYDNLAASYNNIMADVNVLNNVGELAQETRQMFNNTLDRIQSNENLALRQAANKAASLSNANSWQIMKQEVEKLADQQGFSINMEQAKGLYIINGDSITDQDIIDQLKADAEEQEKIESQRANSKEAWSAMIACAQNGLEFSADEILKLLESGEAKDANDIVNILKSQQNINATVDPDTPILDDERSQEIYDAFNKVFNEAGLSDQVVYALTDLCFAQQANPDYMQGKTGEELANEILKNYQ